MFELKLKIYAHFKIILLKVPANFAGKQKKHLI